MSLRIRGLQAQFGAEIQGGNISAALTQPDKDVIEAAINKYAVVIFRDQAISDEEQIAFAKNFGVLELSNAVVLSKRSRLSRPEMVDISNIATQDGRLKGADDPGRMQSMVNYLWHSDASSKPVQGVLSMLYAHTIPKSGSQTQFCDLRTAFDDLPDAMKMQIESLRAVHDYARMQEILGFEDLQALRETWPPITRPLASTHPGSDRATLYLSTAASSIEGMSLAEGRLLLIDLMVHATQRQYVFEHHWREGDLVIWDNRCTMHRARPYDESELRDLRRVTTVAVTQDLQQA